MKRLGFGVREMRTIQMMGEKSTSTSARVSTSSSQRLRRVRRTKVRIACIVAIVVPSYFLNSVEVTIRT